MTTILAAAAVVLFAILIGIVVFFFFVYHREELENKDDKNNKIEIKTGQYTPYTDVPSLHPDSCVSVNPFPKYTSKFQAEVSNKIQNRIDQKANEVVHFMNERFDNVYEDIDTLDTRFDTAFDSRDEAICESENRIEKLEKLVRHLYLERDEDMNEIENSVFEDDKLLDTNEDNIE